MKLRGYIHVTKQLRPGYSAETVPALAASAGRLKLERAFRTQLGSGRQTREDESFKNVGDDYCVPHISVL